MITPQQACCVLKKSHGFAATVDVTSWESRLLSMASSEAWENLIVNDSLFIPFAIVVVLVLVLGQTFHALVACFRYLRKGSSLNIAPIDGEDVLGGLRMGFARTRLSCALCSEAFATSPQVLIEKSMKGWKEIEYEVVPNAGRLHYNMLRTTAINDIHHLGVVGECNIQYALNPISQEYCIIEASERPILVHPLWPPKPPATLSAFIAPKLGLFCKNSVTKVTSTCFKPSLDYVVVKIPQWDLKKFNHVSRLLSSSMKSVGEVMSVGRTFEEMIQKAIWAIDDQFSGFTNNDFVENIGEELVNIDEELVNLTDKRIFAISWLFTVDTATSWRRLSSAPSCHATWFLDRQLAICISSNELAVRRLHQEASISPFAFVKQIDTVATEFPAYTNYLYMTYNAVEHDINFTDRVVIVLGSVCIASVPLSSSIGVLSARDQDTS
ncbi:hypothetical protein BDZ97DRAFT_2083772 [Flammula alnicola]|nr:hypothetical protein BDZ97DRAFT_2083772 [Flammula alnicola]